MRWWRTGHQDAEWMQDAAFNNREMILLCDLRAGGLDGRIIIILAREDQFKESRLHNRWRHSRETRLKACSAIDSKPKNLLRNCSLKWVVTQSFWQEKEHIGVQNRQGAWRILVAFHMVFIRSVKMQFFVKISEIMIRLAISILLGTTVSIFNFLLQFPLRFYNSKCSLECRMEEFFEILKSKKRSHFQKSHLIFSSSREKTGKSESWQQWRLYLSPTSTHGCKVRSSIGPASDATCAFSSNPSK